MTTRTITLLAAGLVAIAAAADCPAQAASPGDPPPAPVAQSEAAPAAEPSNAEPNGAEGGQAAESQPAPNAAAITRAIAQWARAIGGRICLGPKLYPGDRVSKPDIRDQSQRWHVSVPTFADARLSSPPKRAMPAAEALAAEQTEDAPVDQQTPVQTAAESGDH